MERYFISIIFIAFYLTGFTQNYPNKGDNTIIIETQNLDSLNFMDFGRYLVKNGYSFSQKDKDFYVLITNPKESKKGKVDYKLIISFEGNNIIIQAQFSILSFVGFALGDMEMTWYDWDYVKSKSDYRNKVFLDFDPVLRGYNENIKYEKR